MAYCTKCGAKAPDGAGFCTKCGARLRAAQAAEPEPQVAQEQRISQEPARTARAAATSVAGTYATISRTASMAAAAGGAVALPWQTVRSGDRADVQAIIAAAAPSLLAVAPRPNLRWPAAGIAFTLAIDIAISLLTGRAVNVPMLAMRVVTGAGTSLLGALTGSKGGGLRKATAFVSVAYGLVQLISLVVSAYAAIATPVTLMTLLPSIVAVASGLYLSITTAVSGLKR